MLICNLWLTDESEWLQSDASGRENDIKGVYQTAYTAIFTYLDQNIIVPNDGQLITVRLLDKSSNEINDGFKGHSKPVLTFTDENNKTVIIADDKKTDAKKIAASVNAFLNGEDGNGNGTNSGSNGNGLGCMLDTFLDVLGVKQWKKQVLGSVAIYFAAQAMSETNNTKKIGNVIIASYLGYEAFNECKK